MKSFISKQHNFKNKTVINWEPIRSLSIGVMWSYFLPSLQGVPTVLSPLFKVFESCSSIAHIIANYNIIINNNIIEATHDKCMHKCFYTFIR